MNGSEACPETGSLHHLLEGDLPEDQQGDLSRHLDTCAPCQCKLQELAADEEAWAETARRLRSATEPAAEPSLRRTLEELESKADLGGTQTDGRAEQTWDLAFLGPPRTSGHLGRLGHYEVIEEIGRGGMGVVLKALDETLHRVVAIKVMAPQLAASPVARRRFSREAQAAAAVRDEHVIDIHAVDEVNGLPYLVMEYVRGISLQERLACGGPLELREILRIGVQSACGLAAAHAQGLVHRDIKPANILLEAPSPPTPLPRGARGEDRVKLTDFGLARAVDDASFTQSGVVAGTPRYMAPEQARGEPADHRADLFSLGSVLYALCTGRAPFCAATALATLRLVSEEAPRPIREINPAIPEWLAEVVARLHAKDPGRRFQSAAEVADLLGRRLAEYQQPAPGPAARDGEPAAPPPARPSPAGAVPRRGTVWWRRRQQLAFAAVLLGGGMLAAATFTLRTRHGTLVVKTAEPDVQVLIDGEDKLTIDSQKVGRVELIPGEHQLTVKRGQEELLTDTFTLRSGGEVVIHARWEPRAAPGAGKTEPPPGPAQARTPVADEAWIQVVSTLRPELQVEVVKDELKKRNPGFDGQVKEATIKDGVVTSLVLQSDDLADLTPVRVFSGLKMLVCAGSDKGKLADLSPLKGMGLETLQLPGNRIKDLAPLKGMPALTTLRLTSNPISELAPIANLPLKELYCNDTQVRDLSPLKGLQLRSLHCASTHVRDLSPLQGMPLEFFACYRSPLRDAAVPIDLAPLKGLPLKEVDCEFLPDRDADLLRSIQTLETIIGQPAAEFWKKVDAERAAFAEWAAALDKMPPDKQVEAVAARLKERNPGFDGQVTPTVQDGAVTGLALASDAVKDISPVRALGRLQVLRAAGSEPGKGTLANLWPLKSMPLTRLDVANNPGVADLAALAAMRLTHADFRGTAVDDLRPLKGMPLVEIDVPIKNERDRALLQAMPTLEKVNGHSPADPGKEEK